MYGFIVSGYIYSNVKAILSSFGHLMVDCPITYPSSEHCTQSIIKGALPIVPDTSNFFTY